MFYYYIIHILLKFYPFLKKPFRFLKNSAKNVNFRVDRLEKLPKLTYVKLEGCTDITDEKWSELMITNINIKTLIKPDGTEKTR